MMSRDVDRTQAVLAGWFAAHHPDARHVRMTGLEIPRSGFSGELMLCDAHWTEGGEQFERGLVVRVEPTSHQLFLDTRFEEQYRTQDVLSTRTDIPVPRAVGFEQDASVLGARFYVTERVSGHCLDPSFGEQWWLGMAEAEQRLVWFGCLDHMAQIHRLDWSELGLDFLHEPGRGDTHLAQQLHYYREFYEWSVQDGPRRPVLEDTFDRLAETMPVQPPSALLWGDARHGNVLYDARGRSTAIIDWEMVALGPAEIDVSWCLALDRMSNEHPAMAPFPSMDASLSYYERELGRPLQDLEYYVTFSLLRTAIIVDRLEALTRLVGAEWAYPNGAMLQLEVMADPARTPTAARG